MSLHLWGISRSRDVPRMARQVAPGSVGPVRFDPKETIAGPNGDAWWVRSGELAAAVARSTRADLEPVQHARALTAIHRHICVLPIRFGTVIPNEEVVRDLLQARRRDLIRSLDHFDGTCEMGLRISSTGNWTVPREPQPESPSPRAYLARRHARYEHKDRLDRQSQVVLNRYLQALDGLYRQWRKLAASPPGLVRLAFLVEQERVKLFRDRLETLEETPEIQCILLGPWPPYSFV